MTTNVSVCILCLGLAGARVDENEEAERIDMLVRLAESITNVDDGYQDIRVDNGSVFVRTSEIRKIVQRGTSIVPHLLRIMQVEKLSFDTFVRCSSTCEQILQSFDKDVRIYWDGGAGIVRGPKGVDRFVRDGQLDDATFRRRVIDDIKAKHETLKRKQKKQSR